MTEPDNTPVFDPATDADAPTEETSSPAAPVEESAPAAPTEETTPADAPVVEPEPVEVSPEAPDATADEAEAKAEADFNSPEVDAQPVPGVPSSTAAVSDQPVQTDNRERPEDGEQDVTQDPTAVPSEDEDPDVVA